MDPTSKTKFLVRLVVALPLIAVTLILSLLALFVKPLTAWAATLDVETTGSLVTNGETIASMTHYYQILGGSDGTNYRAVQVDASGNLQVDILSGGGGEIITTGADNVVNTTDGQWVYSALMGYESIGGVWDRVHMDTVGNLLVSLGSALDSTNDSVTAVGQFGDGGTSFTQETSKVFATGFLFDDTVGTALAENDIAAGRIDAKRAIVNVLEGATTRGLFAEVVTAGADDVANTTNGLWTYTGLMAYEAVGGVWDRVKMDTSGSLLVSLGTGLDADNDSVSIEIGSVIPQLDNTDIMAVSIYGTVSAAGDTAVAMLTAGADNIANTQDGLFGYTQQMSLDQSGTIDRVKTTHITGFTSFPSAACTVVTVTASAAACGTTGHGAVGSFYTIQSDSRMTCRAEEDATGPAVVTATDMIVESPGVYYWSPVDTNTDTICCDNVSGNSEARVCAVTFP